jgi:hypothetical protein
MDTRLRGYDDKKNTTSLLRRQESTPHTNKDTRLSGYKKLS